MLPDHDPDLSKLGYPASEDALVRDYQALAYSVVRSYRGRGIEEDDLRQEALLGLLEAYRRFDGSRGTRFSTYAHIWVKKRVLAFIGALDTQDQTPLENTLLDQTPAPAEREEPKALDLPDAIPPLERSILILSYERGLSLKEIGVELGLSTERVKQLRAKALRRMRGSMVSGE